MKQQLYMMVKDALKEDISSNKYKTGDKLPSENELCEMFGVGKATVRQALNILVDTGYIYSVKRTGYFVAEPKNDKYILTFDELNIRDENVADIRVLYANMTNGSNIKTGLYRLGENIRALKIGRIFNYLDTPVCYEEKYLLYTKQFRLRDNDLFSGNSSELINKYIMAYSVKKSISADVISASEMSENYLRVKPNFPILRVTQAYLDRYERPFGFCMDYYHKDYMSLSAKTCDNE